MKSEGMKDDRMAGDGMAEELCCCHKHKERSEKEYRDLINRLNRIEGQIRGIKGMVERDAYCPARIVTSSLSRLASVFFIFSSYF